VTHPAGHYSAQGDPPGTIRYWDGHQWIGEPIPAPPTGAPDLPSTVRFGGLGSRLGAVTIDVVFIGSLARVANGLIDADNHIRFTRADPNLATVAFVAAVYLASVVFLATAGGTPGKLAFGLRVTAEDATSPIGWPSAATRSLHEVLRLVPFSISTVLGLGILITSIMGIVADKQRRSAYDRLTRTRVVRTR